MKSNGHQVFNVPNTEEGLDFIHLARKFLNRKYSTSCRGRAKNRKAKGGTKNGIRLANADWIAFYISSITSRSALKKNLDEYRIVNTELHRENLQLKGELAAYKHSMESIKKVTHG